MPRKKSLTSPLIFRPGARYRCFGDGLCCSDIHILGPMSGAERKRVAKVDPDGYSLDDENKPVLRVAHDGGCHFLQTDQRCGIHATSGPKMKPDFCRRFPVGLTATPHGGRVTTEHRCTCRSLGDRPLLTPENVSESLQDRNGKIWAERTVMEVNLTKKERIDFDAWRVIEADLLGRLLESRTPVETLCAKNHDVLVEVETFPKLKKSDWKHEFDQICLGALDGSSFGFAATWFAEHGLRLLDPKHRLRLPVRPWNAAFARAELRPATPRTHIDVIGDWLADEVWALRWTDLLSFDVARAELATRTQIALAIAGSLRELGVKDERSGSEAVMIVELVGESSYWSDIVDLFKR